MRWLGRALVPRAAAMLSGSCHGAREVAVVHLYCTRVRISVNEAVLRKRWPYPTGGWHITHPLPMVLPISWPALGAAGQDRLAVSPLAHRMAAAGNEWNPPAFPCRLYRTPGRSPEERDDQRIQGHDQA
jgi:hypothetical protein